MDQTKQEKIIHTIETLPPLPFVLKKLLETIEDDRTAARDLAEIVSQDPVIAAEILKLVNSAVYSLEVKVTSLQHAVVIIGFEAIKKLALGMAVVNTIANIPIYKEALHDFWIHSIETAITAKKIALHLPPSFKVTKTLAEEIFVGGLLHDIGKIIFTYAMKFNYLHLLKQTKVTGNRTNLCVLEKNHFGMDHTDVGDILSRKWLFPTTLRMIIKYHNNPSEIVRQYPEREMYIALCCVFIADTVSTSLHREPVIKKICSNDFKEYRKFLNITDDLLKDIYGSLEHDVEDIIISLHIE